MMNMIKGRELSFWKSVPYTMNIYFIFLRKMILVLLKWFSCRVRGAGITHAFSDIWKQSTVLWLDVNKSCLVTEQSKVTKDVIDHNAAVALASKWFLYCGVMHSGLALIYWTKYKVIWVLFSFYHNHRVALSWCCSLKVCMSFKMVSTSSCRRIMKYNCVMYACTYIM